MKTYIVFFISILSLVFCSISMKAQDVYISVPVNNIFERTEFSTVKNILNTRNHENWRIRIGSTPWWPTIRSISGNNFLHTTLRGASVPTTVLHWRLASIGGKIPLFRSGDTWPGFKWFNTDEQYWYQPATTNGGYTAGDVAFTFKIPSAQISANAFNAGNYSIDVDHNYGSSGWFTIEFIPNSLKIFLTIPAAISWISNTPIAYYEVSTLDQYRSESGIMDNLFLAEVASTVGFNLMVKTSSSTIQSTPLSVGPNRPVSLVTLGSTDPKIVSAPLSSTWQNYASSSFGVEPGNRNNFPLHLSISKDNFKNHFFNAGIYTFQINLEAKSTNGTVSAAQNTDVTIKVPPLSEIKIPTSGNTVNFEFNTASHYSQEHSKVIPNQIRLSNNETYELYVKSDTPFFKRSGIQSDVPSSILQVGVEGYSENVALTPISQKIITNGTPVLDKNLDIKYTIPLTAAQSLVGKEKTTYSINVIYSFTAL